VPPAEVDADGAFDIFVDHLGEFGKDLNSAIHSEETLPYILSLSEDTKNTCAAMLAASRVQKIFERQYGDQIRGGDKRFAEQSKDDEVRYTKTASRFNGPPPSPGSSKKICFVAFLGGKCERADCDRAHNVQGVPGIDKCPYGDDCRRKHSCPLAWSHTQPSSPDAAQPKI